MNFEQIIISNLLIFFFFIDIIIYVYAIILRLNYGVVLNTIMFYYNKFKMFFRSDCFDEDTRLQQCSIQLKLKLESLNNIVYNEIQGHLDAAVDNCIGGIRYFRVQPDGPKLTNVSTDNPLVPR